MGGYPTALSFVHVPFPLLFLPLSFCLASVVSFSFVDGGQHSLGKGCPRSNIVTRFSFLIYIQLF